MGAHLDVEERVAIEVDSCEWHAVITYFQSDRQRDRRLAVQGWITLRYTDLDKKETPEQTAAEIKKVLKTDGVSSDPKKGWVAHLVVDTTAYMW